MAIFSVTAPSTNQVGAEAIVRAFQNENIKAWDGHWFVSDSGTAKEVVSKIEAAAGGKPGTVIVVTVANYWGIASPEVWEWLKSKLESQ